LLLPTNPTAEGISRIKVNTGNRRELMGCEPWSFVLCTDRLLVIAFGFQSDKRE
jgi:hypothetical protein